MRDPLDIDLFKNCKKVVVVYCYGLDKQYKLLVLCCDLFNKIVTARVGMQRIVFATVTIVSLFVISAFMLPGCRTNANEKESTALESKTEVTETTDLTNKGKYENLPKPCAVTKSPPIKDKSKIRALLIKQGKIHADMSEEKIQQLVREYITKKNQAYKQCKK